MPRNLNASLMKPLVVLALPGMYLVYKFHEYKRQQQEQNRRKITERELDHLNHKIDKLLTKLEENEPELASSQDEECVICISAKATMQTFPCGHRVVCRKCFVRTIQMAVSQRMLPLRCVICRAKILRLKQSKSDPTHPPGVRSGATISSLLRGGGTAQDPHGNGHSKCNLHKHWKNKVAAVPGPPATSPVRPVAPPDFTHRPQPKKPVVVSQSDPRCGFVRRRYPHARRGPTLFPIPEKDEQQSSPEPPSAGRGHGNKVAPTSPEVYCRPGASAEQPPSRRKASFSSTLKQLRSRSPLKALRPRPHE